MNHFQNYTQEQNTYNQYGAYRAEQAENFDAQQYERQNSYQQTIYHPYSPQAESAYAGQQQLQGHVPPVGQSHFTSFDLHQGLGGNFAAGLTYIGFWLTGLLFLLFERKNRLVCFHAMQSLLFFGGVNILYIVFISIVRNEIPFLVGFAVFAFVIMNIVAVVGWFVGMIGAFKGKFVKLPIVGDIAERFVNGDVVVK